MELEGRYVKCVKEDKTKPMENEKNGSVMARRSVMSEHTALTRRGTDFGRSRDRPREHNNPECSHLSSLLSLLQLYFTPADADIGTAEIQCGQRRDIKGIIAIYVSERFDSHNELEGRWIFMST